MILFKEKQLIIQILNQSKKNELVQKVKILKDNIAKLQESKISTNLDLNNFLMELPNFLDDSVPDGKNDSDPDSSGGEPQKTQPVVPAEKLKTKADPDKGLLGGSGMPDPTPA